MPRAGPQCFERDALLMSSPHPRFQIFWGCRGGPRSLQAACAPGAFLALERVLEGKPMQCSPCSCLESFRTLMAIPSDTHVCSEKAYLGSHTERTVTLSDGDTLTVGELHGRGICLPSLRHVFRPSTPSLSLSCAPVAGGRGACAPP